jgi:amino acid adenylation domain-containing protein/non-ribosomal peptide synthase protein (TIGR01720 family)
LDVIKIWSEILQVEQLKPTDHFFLEGGNSILAVQVIAKCRDIFSIDIDLRLLFDTPILGDFVTAIEQSIKNNLQTQHRNLKNSHITKQPRTQGLPLSSGQSRLWFLWQLDPMSSAYNIPAGMHLSGEINNVALKTCFQQLLNRHESLRTRFLEKDSTVLQYIDPPSEFIIEHHDISMFNEQERQVKAEDFREQEAQRSFDLSAGELFRVKLIRLSQSEHLLLISLHHIIADGWSLNLLLTEFCQLYKLSSQGHDVNSVFKPLARQYADYACWQQQWLNQDEAAHQLDYWQKQLAGELPILQLATDFPRTSSNKLSNDLSREPQQYKNADRFSVIIDEKLTKNLRTFAQSQDCTLFMLLLAGFKSLLHRYTGQEDILIGVPSANRNSTEIQDIVGFFINTIVLRSNISSRLTFIQLLQQIKLTTLDAQMHQDIPINEVVEAIFSKKGQQFKRDVHSESPLFQVMFNHQQRGLNAQSLPDLTAEELSWHSRIAKCDLQLHSEENNQGQVLLSFDYNTELFEKRTIERLSHHLSCLLEHVIKEPEACIGDINLLDVNEHQCLTSWSETAGISSSPSNFNHLIDNLNHQVKLVPNEIVLQWQNGSFTYQELDTKANRLAHYLTSQGVQPEVCVGILVERSPQMLVGLLAIIKAGGAYLPLDPSYPNERLSYMLLDSGVQILLTEQTFLKEDFLTEFQAKNKLISVDNLTLEHLPTNSPVVNLHKDNLAYIIYTSGSTGLPKGVGISHAALQERLEWMKYEYQFDKHDVFLQKAPISFDVSVWECFLPLITGGRLVLSAPGDQRDPDRLVRLVREYGVTVLHFVPPMMQLFIEETGVESCNSLRYLFSGGEVLTVTLRNEIFARLPNIALHNRYGPTETTINATHWHCDVEDGDRSPIGKPLGNVTCQVFDNELRPASIGMPGELYIGGVGLARGYINSKKQYPDPVMEKDNNTASDNPKSHNFGRAALTAERFIPDPMHYGARLYRSGDIVRWNNEGSLDYFGRIDKQIKLRGYRIDPQEIEVQLLAQSIIKQAVVVVHEPKDLSVKSNAQLIAYYVPTQSIEEDVADSRKITEILKNALAKILPSYMIPSYFISLQKLPITANGKLDYHLLPEPNATFNPDVEHIPPVTLLEEQIAEVWQEMLGVTRLGLADDFFRCGGHSLLATQIVSRIRLQCNVDLPLKVLFEHSQLGDFVAQVQHAQQAGRINKMLAIDIIDRNRPVPLSSSQQRLWFLWKIEPDSPAYNVGGMARLTGVFYVEHFAAALQELIERHETLRTTFPSVDGVPIQCVSAKSSIVIQQHDFTHFDTQGCQQQLQKLADDEAHQPFDLEKGPLLRACLVKVSEKEHIFSLTLHHIITEGWAMDIFAREIGEIYQAFLENKPSPLIPLKVGYLDYSVWHNKWLASGEAKRQLDYWTNKLGDEHPVLSLPSDRPRPIIQSYKGGLYRFILEDGLANKVHHFNVKHGLTMFMTMTSVLAVLLYRYSGQNDLRIGAPIANRIRPESEGLIGAFLNTQVLRCQLDGQMTVDQFLLQIRNTVIEGQSHQDLPFDQLVDALKPPRSTAYNPLFQVMCNVQRWNFQQSRELAGMKVDYIINDAEATKFDLNLEVTDLNQQLACCLTYSRDLFNEERIASMATHLINLLTAMVNNPEQRIAELALFSNEDKPSENVSEEVKKLCLSQYNNSDVKPDDGQYCLQDLFSRQVKKTPDAPALSFAEKTLTYAELDHKSNQLARRLRYLGVGAEDYVGLALERSLEMVIGLLAILKAGGAYVPLDPGYPVERLKEIIEDSRIGLLLSDQALFETLGELPSKIKVLCLEKDMNELATYSIDALPSINHPLHQAYLIYTSGSTGKPKGVMVAHGEISSHCQSVIKRFNMCSDDCELHFYSINFDAATERLLAPLLCGSHVVLRGQSQWGVEEICQLIRQYNVNTLGLTPSYGSQLAQWLINRQETLPIRICITGGEMLMAEHLQKIRLAFQPEYFFNAYGPTETVVMPLSCLAPPNLAEHALGVPIGHLVGNRLAYILDENLALSPQGSVGELYVGGRCLARGYHDRRGLTAERFIPNPFTIDQPYNQASGRLYRTGDLVRQGTDGLIEYVGRLDYQVKIRGFRIELGEIESKILAHQTVDETVVLAIDLGSNKQLVAYVASVEATMNSVENEALITQLKQLLKKKLPDYMVPAHWVILPVLPTGPNGKLDRKALPLPDVEQNKQDYVLPSTEVEQLLAEIWTEVLATDTIGINDNFFELGGDSILSIQVVSRARQIGLHFSPRDLFQHQNIKVLAEFCEQQDHEQKHKFNAEQDLIKGEAKLTPIQHWFFSLSMPNRHHWNQAILLSPTQYLESELLEHILHKMLQQHDALRLVFNDQDQPKAHHKLTNKDSQSILETVTVENINQAEQVYSNLFNKLQRSLNLANGPLLKALLVTESGSTGLAYKQRLFIVVHHLVIDGVSWRILIDDIQTSYQQLSNGMEISLPHKTSAFRDWTRRLENYATNDYLKENLSWWQAQLGKSSQSLEEKLPTDYPVVNNSDEATESDAVTITVSLSREKTEKLLQKAPATYHTQVNDLLLTALSRTFCQWSGFSSILVQLEGHGREEIFDDIDLTRTVGWFTSVYPLRLTPSSLMNENGETKSKLLNLADDIKTIKEQLRSVPDKGLSYGILSYLADDACRVAMAELPQAQVTFNYLGQFDQSLGRDALFKSADETTGLSRDENAPLPNLQSIDSQIANGKLVIRWTYSTKCYGKNTIENLANDYLQQLEDIVEHCVSDELATSQISRLTPSDFPLAKLTQKQLDTLPIPAEKIEDIYPLTSMQEGLLLHTLLEPGTGLYYMQDRYRINSEIVPKRFVKAWQLVVSRHEALRASFNWNAGETMLQIIHKPYLIDVEYIDWRQENPIEHEQRLQAMLKEEREAGFDLLNSPPFHLRLICLGEKEYWFIMSNHHILIDAWCRSILMNDFFNIYTALSEEKESQLNAPSSYRDYIVWLQDQDVNVHAYGGKRTYEVLSRQPVLLVTAH